MIRETDYPSIGKSEPLSADWGVCGRVCTAAINAIRTGLDRHLYGTGARGAQSQDPLLFASRPRDGGDGYPLEISGGVSSLAVRPVTDTLDIYQISLDFFIRVDPGAQAPDAWVDDGRRLAQSAAAAECACRALRRLHISVPMAGTGSEEELVIRLIDIACVDLLPALHLSAQMEIAVSEVWDVLLHPHLDVGVDVQ